MEQPPGVPTIPDTNYAPYYLISTGILGAIGVILCCLRAYTKLRPSPHLTADDYLIIVAVVFSITGYCCAITASTRGWGHVSSYVSDPNKITTLKFTFLVQFFWILSICLIRLSIAISLLRLSLNRLWKWSVWALIVVQLLLSTGWLIVLFAWCRPLQSNWQPLLPGAECWDFKHQTNFGWVTAAIFTFMDLVFALMPIKLVWQLQRSIREKILISCLMAMGLLATASVCVKMTTFTKVGQGDPLSSTVYPSFLAKLEEVLGIIAACMPCLKSPAERLLRRIGVLSERYVNTLTRPSFVVSHNQAPKDYTVSPQNGNPRKNWRTSVDDVELEEQPPSRSSSFTRINHLDSTGKSDWNSSIATATTTNPASPADNQASSGSASGPTGTSARGWEAV